MSGKKLNKSDEYYRKLSEQSMSIHRRCSPTEHWFHFVEVTPHRHFPGAATLVNFGQSQGIKSEYRLFCAKCGEIREIA
jgi:hypothetical protein